MASKFDKFIEADIEAGKMVEHPTARTEASAQKLTKEIQDVFGKYGTFHIDNADFILRLSRETAVSPEAIAVTWMNETTFRFYSEPNKNNTPENFDAWDVGPFQINVYWTKGDIAVKRIYSKDLTEQGMFGTVAGSELFNGDPYQNALAAIRRLRKMGKTDEERVVIYTGPKARPSRLKSWKKFGPLFRKFFEVYAD